MKIEKVALAIIIDKNNKILLTQRVDPQNRLTHLKWQFPGGGVEKNEQIIDACIREAYEEVGLKIKILSQSPQIIRQKFPDSTYDLYGFLAEAISGTIDTSSDDETGETRWATLSEIKKIDCLDNTYEMAEMCIKDYGRKLT